MDEHMCLIYWNQDIDPFLFVLQSAAMEETVIWEQHTVTLHRVSVYNSLIHSTLSSHLSFFPSLPVSGILILNYVLCVLHFFLSVLCPYISFLSLLRRPAVAAGCVVLKQ